MVKVLKWVGYLSRIIAVSSQFRVLKANVESILINNNLKVKI